MRYPFYGTHFGWKKGYILKFPNARFKLHLWNFFEKFTRRYFHFELREVKIFLMLSLTVSFLCFWNDLHTQFDLVNYSGFQINLVETLADFFAIWWWNSLDKLFPVNCSLHPHRALPHLRLVATFYFEITALMLLSKNNRERL